MPKHPRETNNWTALWNEIAQVFSPGAPIDESELFAGRIDQLRDLVNAVNQRGQHAIVFGERGVGKTSLANIFTSYVHRPVSHVVATRINCDGISNFQILWHKVFQELQIHTEVSRTTGPDDIRRILSQISLNDVPIIVFDEFDRLKPGRTKGLLADTIKGLSDHSVGTTIVIVGVADSVTELLAEHASIGRALVEIPMPRMSNEEISELIDKRIKRLGMSMSGHVTNKIVSYSQGLPHYAHLIGLYACQEAAESKSKTVALENLDTAITSCLNKAQQTIRECYHKATSSPRPDNLFKQVLLACSLAPTDSLGFFAASDVVEPLTEIMRKRYDIPSFARHLKEFCSKERGPLLERRGVTRKFRYRFCDPLMQPYITLNGVASGLLPASYHTKRNVSPIA
jgi:Cdc6-like AAA superfamily ATPase